MRPSSPSRGLRQKPEQDVGPHRSVGYAFDNLTTELDVPTPYPRNLVLLSPEVMSRSFSLSGDMPGIYTRTGRFERSV